MGDPPWRPVKPLSSLETPKTPRRDTLVTSLWLRRFASREESFLSGYHTLGRKETKELRGSRLRETEKERGRKRKRSVKLGLGETRTLDDISRYREVQEG